MSRMNDIATKNRGAGVKAAFVAAVVAASFGVGFGSSHLADAVHGTESVSSVELSRLANCDRAVRAAERYDVAKAEGGNADGELPAYWSAKNACNGATKTVQAAR